MTLPNYYQLRLSADASDRAVIHATERALPRGLPRAERHAVYRTILKHHREFAEWRAKDARRQAEGRGKRENEFWDDYYSRCVREDREAKEAEWRAKAQQSREEEKRKADERDAHWRKGRPLRIAVQLIVGIPFGLAVAVIGWMVLSSIAALSVHGLLLVIAALLVLIFLQLGASR
jgi:F0F1-type ATP synthase assembly protein I